MEQHVCKWRTPSLRKQNFSLKLEGDFTLKPHTAVMAMRRYVYMHTHAHVQSFCESCDWAMLNNVTTVPESSSVKFERGSHWWQNVRFSQHCVSYKGPSEKLLTLYLSCQPNASLSVTSSYYTDCSVKQWCLFYLELLMSSIEVSFLVKYGWSLNAN